jgi:hypothetical protein
MVWVANATPRSLYPRKRDQVPIIIIVIIITIIITISFMQGIYTHIPETNHVPKEYNVAAILSLLFMAPISLIPALSLIYLYISTFRSMCAVSNIIICYYYYYYYFHYNK